MALIYLSCAWVAGIFLGARFNLPLAVIFIGLIPLPLLFFFRQYRKPIILTSLCLIVFFGGVWRYQTSLAGVAENYLRFFNDKGTVEVSGVIARDPEVGDKTTRLYLSAQEVKWGEEWHKASGNALLLVPRYPVYSYGERLLVRGELRSPAGLDDSEYGKYLTHQEIFSIMFYPEIETQAKGEGAKLLEWVYSLRNHLSRTLGEVLPEPQASLAQGIVLGIRGDIPASVKDAFVYSGTAHLLAISGLHLSIVVGILLSFGIWLFGRQGYIYIWLVLGGIWFYALLTGMNPPVLRATIMASVFLVAELLGRQRGAITALFFAAAIMVGVSPRVLGSASFQLSFLAMAGLICFFPPIRSLTRRAVSALLGEGGTGVSVANFVADSFSASLGALIAVWPAIAYYFGIIAWVAPLATLLALPALPGIIIGGALAGGLGLIALPAGQAVAWLAWLFLAYMLVVVKVFAALPQIEDVSVGKVLIGVYYAVLVLLLWVNSNKKSLMPQIVGWLKSARDKSLSLVSGLPKKWLIPPLLLGAILVWVTAVSMPDDNLHISFLDVGQGDALLIQRGSQQVLVDGGSSPQAIGLGLGKEMPFWDRTIDLVVLTHPHADHLTGLVEVLNRYKVKQVLYPDLEYRSPLYDEWFNLIKKKGIKYRLAQAGQRLEMGEVIIEVLNPPSPLLTGTESDIDNNGVVLRLSKEKVSFLLTADLMWEAEWELITRRANLTSTVLKVAHHGSASSTTAEFLAVVNPHLAVISVGKQNPFGHPTDEVIERLKEKLGQENIYRTDERATIELITDGGRLWVRVER